MGKSSPFYRRFPPKTRFKELDQRIFISNDPPFVYFRIPKAANTNVIATLYFARHGNLEAPRREILAHKVSGLRPVDLTEDEVDRVLSAPSFSVVRNPYTRFLSAYINKMTRARDVRHKVLAALGKAEGESVSIDEFIGYLEDGGLRDDGHWCPQSWLIPVGARSLTYLGRIESIESDVEKILTGIYGRPIPFQNYNGGRSQSNDQVGMYLTADRKARIYRLYEEDFDELNYPTSLPLRAPEA